MKRINRRLRGFTLVELLVIIVILALIMLIAIPSVLNAVEVSKKNAFMEYADKVVDLAEKKNITSDMENSKSSIKCTIYNIKSDLGLSNTGNYEGYILVKTTDVNEDDEYVITMWDDNYILRPYNYNNKINYMNEQSNIPDAIEKFDKSLKEELTIESLCEYGCSECTTTNNETIIGKSNLLYDVLKNAAKTGKYAREYTGEHQDSMDKSLTTEKIYYWYGTDDENAKTILEKNNVLLGGHCWQMIRTTDTGGVKLIYNGKAENNKCLPSRTSRSIGTSKFNSSLNSPADVGYMYNIKYVNYTRRVFNTEFKYAKTFTWDGSKYILDEDTSVMVPNVTYTENIQKLYNAHYTCWNTSGECTRIFYIYFIASTSVDYISLSNGKSVENALDEMLYNDEVNKKDSLIKTYIENWYENNMTSYSDYLEDTIFCNNRSQINLDTVGWNPNGGHVGMDMRFKEYRNSGVNPPNDLSCEKETDKFSTLNEKAKLKYKVGLMTSSEMALLNNGLLRNIGETYWLISPTNYWFNSSALNNTISTSKYYTGTLNTGLVTKELAVRPAISIKPGTIYTAGDGSTENPYVI